MKKKRILALFMVLVLVLGLCACGNKKKEDKAQSIDLNELLDASQKTAASGDMEDYMTDGTVFKIDCTGDYATLGVSGSGDNQKVLDYWLEAAGIDGSKNIEVKDADKTVYTGAYQSNGSVKWTASGGNKDTGNKKEPEENDDKEDNSFSVSLKEVEDAAAKTACDGAVEEYVDAGTEFIIDATGSTATLSVSKSGDEKAVMKLWLEYIGIESSTGIILSGGNKVYIGTAQTSGAVDWTEKEKEAEPDSDSGNTSDDGTVVTLTENSGEEKVIFDKKGVVIKATVETMSPSGYKLNLHAINNTGDTVWIDNLIPPAVNDYMTDGYFLNMILKAGEESTDFMYWNSPSIYGGKDNSGVGKLELWLDVIYPNDSYYSQEYICINISGKNNPEDIYADTGTEVYNEDGIVVKHIESMKSSIYGDYNTLYLKNGYDRHVRFEINDISINGLALDKKETLWLTGNHKMLYTLSFYQSALEELGVDSINEITMSLKVTDAYTDEVLKETGPITFTP